MSSILTVMLVGALLAAPESNSAPANAEFKIWAVEVLSEGREEPHFDKGLEEVRDAVKDGKHDTYVNLKTATHRFKNAQPVKTPLTDRYTLSTGPPTRSPDGRYRVKLRLTMKQEEKNEQKSPLLTPDSLLPPQKNTPRPEKEIEALSSELLLQPGKKVVVRGLRSDEGKEMILVVSLSVPEEGESAR